MVGQTDKTDQISKKWFINLNKFFSFFENILLFIAGLGLITMVVVVCFGVFSREILNASKLWTNDLAAFLMVYVAFLSAPWILKHNGHVIVDFVVNLLKGKIEKILLIFTLSVSLVFFGIFFWFSSRVTIENFVKGRVSLDNIPWPEYLFYLPIAVGCFFLIIRLALKILESIFRDNNSISEL